MVAIIHHEREMIMGSLGMTGDTCVYLPSVE
jgi:hypothetical protein